MKKRKIIKRIFFAAIILAAAAGLYAYKEFNRKNKSLHDMEAVAALQQTEILSQFSTDEKKATAAYAGKAILVSGIVKGVDKDDKGFCTLVLGDDGSMSSVRCCIDSPESAQAATMQLNSPVKIKGICTGYVADELGLGADVILNRCVIEKSK